MWILVNTFNLDAFINLSYINEASMIILTFLDVSFSKDRFWFKICSSILIVALEIERFVVLEELCYVSFIQ